MMNKRNIWLLVIGVVLLIVLGFVLNQKQYNWEENYEAGSQDPYGTFLLSKLLDGYFPKEDFKVLKDSFLNSLPLSAGDSAHANYVFIGAGMHLRESDVDRLLDFVNNGNQAIISTRVLPYDLMFELYFEECDSMWWEGLSSVYDSIIQLNFDHPDLRQKTGYSYQYYYENIPTPYEWKYFENFYFCDLEEGLVPIGKMNDELINFVQRPYGAGNFYLHTTPLAFSNYHLLNQASLEYAEKVFSHLEEGPIYWDQYSGVSERVGKAQNDLDLYGQRNLSARSPLQFILSKPPLTWAWYLLLAAVLLFMIFLSRRRQRIIPVLRKNTNTSLEFLTTIGHLYFLQNNHKQLALEKMQFFRNFVREKYHLQGLELDDEFKEKLGQRSEVSRPILDKIVLMYNNIKNASIVTENTLIDFHKAMEQFYRHCK